MKTTVKKLCEALEARDGYLILTHKKPDLDTLGSALALVRLLQALGKNARAVCPEEPTEKQIRMLDGYTFSDGGEPYSTVVTVDVASPSLLGRYEELSGRVYIKTDHHRERERFGEISLVDTGAAACAEIIFDVCRYFEKKGKFRLDKSTASYLYCGISSDTGGFIYPNTTAKTHKKAAYLLGLGIPSAVLDEQMHIIKTEKKLRAEGYTAQNLIFFHGKKTAAVCLDKALMKELGITDEDAADIVDVPRSVEGVEAALSVKEDVPGSYRVSLRSRSVDVSAVAAVFGGGGHPGASGCTVKASSAREACGLVAEELGRAYQNAKE
ncbi:MAG: bifunctional oligoribonuclease/PAP phosphatase NrnA [Clostridia bacterium]|nr:bifunctional oligoribonuclease/PAP phosphatase NrnA [Clostridia bacterium]